MKRKISMTLVLLMAFISCEGPETTVTNIVGRNGSVLRKAEMRHSSPIPDITGFKVPVDSTWNLKDSLFISAEGDTTWFILAEKLFESADAINEAYLADTGKNSSVTRTAIFSRKFKWFTTTWYFAEKCDKSLLHGYPIADYLKPEEVAFLELPDRVSDELVTGPDSIALRSLIDSVQQHTEQWMIRSLISEFIEDAGALCESSGKDSLTTAILRSHEDDFYRLVGEDANPDLPATLDVVYDGPAGCFDLPAGHPTRLQRLQTQGFSDPDLLTAALLHDVGKTLSPLSTLDRILVVLAHLWLNWGWVKLNFLARKK